MRITRTTNHELQFTEDEMKAALREYAEKHHGVKLELPEGWQTGANFTWNGSTPRDFWLKFNENNTKDRP